MLNLMTSIIKKARWIKSSYTWLCLEAYHEETKWRDKYVMSMCKETKLNMVFRKYDVIFFNDARTIISCTSNDSYHMSWMRARSAQVSSWSIHKGNFRLNLLTVTQRTPVAGQQSSYLCPLLMLHHANINDCRNSYEWLREQFLQIIRIDWGVKYFSTHKRDWRRWVHCCRGVGGGCC